MFDVDTRELKNMEGDLKVFASRAYPFATKETVNRSAFKAREIAQDNIRDKMTLRNTFSVKSIRVEKTNTLNVSRQQALVGSIADYMKDQEFGVTISKKGKHGVAITTSYAAGMSEGAQPRTKVARKPNRLASIQIQRKNVARMSRRQRTVAVIKEAASSGSKYVFLDLGRRKGIFKVVGGKRSPRIKMVHDLTRPSVVVPRNPWLAPAVAATGPQVQAIYYIALEAQMLRHGLFR